MSEVMLPQPWPDLRPGDEVAMRGTDEIKPGTKVRMKEVKPAAL
jgi:hypothetical protein